LVNQTLQIMKSRFLFPHGWKITGTILFLIGFVLYLVSVSSGIIDKWTQMHRLVLGMDSQILVNDAQCLTLIIGLLLIGFSKEEIEDEQIAQLRSDCLQWAIYVNYGIFILCVIFINGTAFLTVMMYNIISPILFFIIRFRWKVYLLNRLLKKEENQALNHI
jgi:hypothetical protein